MKDNRNILNEAFFKKASYEEKRNKRMPQYTPVDLKKSSGYTAGTTVAAPAYQVTDTEEVKRRLAGAFGVTFGNNNVRSMASKAIKEFPILISDAVEPETALMVKKLVEEQYAEYINLLISNQVVNLADYRSSDTEGNIAIQALDSISGSDFRRSRIADKAARSGSIDADTVFQNVPLYNLLRENAMELKTGDVITDTLLENAIVIPTENVDKLVEFFDYNTDEIGAILDEASPYNREDISKRYALDDEDLDKYSDDSISKKLLNRDITIDAKRGFQGMDDTGKEIYSRLTTGDIVLDEKRFDQAINRSVGEMLTMPENALIRDKFEKATFLLQSRRISGIEYYQYLTLRLGIPVSDKARLELTKRFKVADIRKYGQGIDKTDSGRKSGFVISANERKAISENRMVTDKVLKDILEIKLKDVLKISAAGGIIGAGAGLLTWCLTNSIFAFSIAGAVVGSSFILIRLIKKIREKNKNKKELNKTRIQGWERVERLIEDMELNQAEALGNRPYDSERINLSNLKNPNTFIYDNGEKEINDIRDNYAKIEYTLKDAKKDYLAAVQDTNKMIASHLKESVEIEDHLVTFNECFKLVINEENMSLIEQCAYEVAIENQGDKQLCAQLLTEKTLAKTMMPMTVKYIEKKDNKDILVTPSFMARDSYAYGSVEMDRKAMKDRRYNQPLIMTIRFKERFDDEKYSDSELTAVIGILGKIVRIPSAEMEYILKESVHGKTIEGIFNGSDLKSTVEDMFSVSKISKDLKNLPQSADIWRNLEKVTTLAAANKISAKRNGNISNAHIIFSQKEIDAVRTETGIDLLKDIKKSIALMKRYSAFTLMVANDAGQRMSILDDQDSLSWNVLPYSALSNKDGGDQLNAALTKMMRL